MAISTDKVAETFLNIVADTPISNDFPLYAEDEIEVIYGLDSLTATLNVDFTVTLDEDDYDTFVVTPLAALITKIDALIAADNNEINYITVRRKLDYLTSVQPETVRLSAFLSREIERINMRFQQLAEELNRSLVIPAGSVGSPTQRFFVQDPIDGRALAWNAATRTFINGPDVTDIIGVGDNAALAQAAATNAAASEAAVAADKIEIEGLVAGSLWSGGVIALSAADSPVTLTDANGGVYYNVDTSAGPVTINLPSIATVGEPFTVGIRKTTADTNAVTVQRNGTDTIDGGTAPASVANAGEARVFSADLLAGNDNWSTANFGLSSGNFVVDTFLAGADYTGGSTTQLTLSSDPGSKPNLDIYFDGVYQEKTEFNVVGTTVTFTAAIPNGVTSVEAKIGASVQINVPADGSVKQSSFAPEVIFVPTGSVLPFAGATAPTGFLKCDGTSVSRTTYAALFTAIGTTYGVGDGSTTFTLPDLRGEFLRGFDDGRGVDAGRALGTAQAEDTAPHTHGAGTLVTDTEPDHTHSETNATQNLSQAIWGGNGGASGGSSITFTSPPAGAHSHTITGATASAGGTETRPRNVALNFIIKI